MMLLACLAFFADEPSGRCSVFTLPSFTKVSASFVVFCQMTIYFVTARYSNRAIHPVLPAPRRLLLRKSQAVSRVQNARSRRRPSCEVLFWLSFLFRSTIEAISMNVVWTVEPIPHLTLSPIRSQQPTAVALCLLRLCNSPRFTSREHLKPVAQKLLDPVKWYALRSHRYPSRKVKAAPRKVQLTSGRAMGTVLVI